MLYRPLSYNAAAFFSSLETWAAYFLPKCRNGRKIEYDCCRYYNMEYLSKYSDLIEDILKLVLVYPQEFSEGGIYEINRDKCRIVTDIYANIYMNRKEKKKMINAKHSYDIQKNVHNIQVGYRGNTIEFAFVKTIMKEAAKSAGLLDTDAALGLSFSTYDAAASIDLSLLPLLPKDILKSIFEYLKCGNILKIEYEDPAHITFTVNPHNYIYMIIIECTFCVGRIQRRSKIFIKIPKTEIREHHKIKKDDLEKAEIVIQKILDEQDLILNRDIKNKELLEYLYDTIIKHLY